ncbi:glutamate--tRNA ligase family protein, partial [Lacisediminihabitans profunda]
DSVVARPTGAPLSTFVNPVDDALMGITHLLRGEDLLSSTPRQIALYHALIDIGLASAIPRCGHLPYVTGDGNKKRSKRDPESNLCHHRDRGVIPEGLLIY